MTKPSFLISIFYLSFTLFIYCLGSLGGKEIYAYPINDYFYSPNGLHVASKRKKSTQGNKKSTSQKFNLSSNSIWSLGLIIGQPSGISGQYKLDLQKALQTVLAYDLLYTHIYVGLDYTQKFQRIEPILSDLYWGIGGFLYTHSGSSHHHNAKSSNGGIGARLSMGLIHEIKNAPFQVFAELGLRSFVIPHIILTFDVALGIRYQFPK